MLSSQPETTAAKRRNQLLYLALACAWLVICVWQRAEHVRFTERLSDAMSARARVMASSMEIMLRAMRSFGGIVTISRLQAYLDELVDSQDLTGVALVNAANIVVVRSGDTGEIDIALLAARLAVWQGDRACFYLPIDLGVSTFGDMSQQRQAIVLPPPEERPEEEWERRQRETPENRRERLLRAQEYIEEQLENLASPEASVTNERPRFGGFGRGRRGFISDERREELAEKYGVRAAVFHISTGSLTEAVREDAMLRAIIVAFGFLAMAAGVLAVKHVARSGEIQLRLMRSRAQNQHLAEMNMAAAGLAHETRNPLNLIRGMAQLIRRDDSTSEAVKGRCGDMIAEVDRVTGQLNEFISFSKPTEPRRVAVSLSELVADVLRPLRAELEEVGVAVLVDCGDARVEADEKMLRQVLFNIVLNASQAMTQGGELRIIASRADGGVALDISDDGPGIPLENREKIFQPYFTTREKEGTGLGLAIVRQIALAHGWEVAFLPNEPTGARFRLTGMNVASV